jgi:hypothetical protein
MSNDDTNESENADEEIVIDEAEEGFLEDRDPTDYPAVLRVTSDPEEAH